MNMGLHIRL